MQRVPAAETGTIPKLLPPQQDLLQKPLQKILRNASQDSGVESEHRRDQDL